MTNVKTPLLHPANAEKGSCGAPIEQAEQFSFVPSLKTGSTATRRSFVRFPEDNHDLTAAGANRKIAVEPLPTHRPSLDSARTT
jgi:hypothetical protein